VRSFYARDKGLSTMGEIVEMLEECCARGPVRAAGGSWVRQGRLGTATERVA